MCKIIRITVLDLYAKKISCVTTGFTGISISIGGQYIKTSCGTIYIRTVYDRSNYGQGRCQIGSRKYFIQNTCPSNSSRTSHSRFSYIAASITVCAYCIGTVFSVIAASVFLLKILRFADTGMLQFIYIRFTDLHTSSTSDKSSGTSCIRIIRAVFFQCSCYCYCKSIRNRTNTCIADHRNKSIYKRYQASQIYHFCKNRRFFSNLSNGSGSYETTKASSISKSFYFQKIFYGRSFSRTICICFIVHMAALHLSRKTTGIAFCIRHTTLCCHSHSICYSRNLTVCDLTGSCLQNACQLFQI